MLLTSYLPSTFHLLLAFLSSLSSLISLSLTSTFYLVNPGLYFSSAIRILWVLLYLGAKSMLHERRSRIPHALCNLCGSNVFTFSTIDISEIVYRDAAENLNVSPPR